MNRYKLIVFLVLGFSLLWTSLYFLYDYSRSFHEAQQRIPGADCDQEKTTVRTIVRNNTHEVVVYKEPKPALTLKNPFHLVSITMNKYGLMLPLSSLVLSQQYVEELYMDGRKPTGFHTIVMCLGTKEEWKKKMGHMLQEMRDLLFSDKNYMRKRQVYFAFLPNSEPEFKKQISSITLARVFTPFLQELNTIKKPSSPAAPIEFETVPFSDVISDDDYVVYGDIDLWPLDRYFLNRVAKRNKKLHIMSGTGKCRNCPPEKLYGKPYRFSFAYTGASLGTFREIFAPLVNLVQKKQPDAVSVPQLSKYLVHKNRHCRTTPVECDEKIASEYMFKYQTEHPGDVFLYPRNFGIEHRTEKKSTWRYKKLHHADFPWSALVDTHMGNNIGTSDKNRQILMLLSKVLDEQSIKWSRGYLKKIEDWMRKMR